MPSNNYEATTPFSIVLIRGGTSTAYSYDSARQLTAETRTGGVSYSIGYSYDAAGNRLTKTAGSSTESYSYDAANKLLAAGTKSYSYDNAGNTTAVSNSATGTTTTLTWDGEERLKTVSGGGVSNAYAYNGLDQRSGKADSGGTSSFLRSGDGIDSPVLSDGAATYNYGSGLTSEVRSGTSKFYQSDALGSTRELTNSVGAVTDAHETDAFGNTIASSGSTPTPFGFAGQAGYQTDSDTGLKLLGHRYYDSSTGRFISRDPIQDGNNWYAYCGNDPVNSLDSEGLMAVLLAAAGVAGGPPVWVILGVVAAVVLLAYVAVVVWEHAQAKDNGSLKTPTIPPPPITNWTDPAKPPNDTGDWQWRGRGEPGSGKGGYHNPGTGQSLTPDLTHVPPIGGHWDWKDAPGKAGMGWRIFPDGAITPKQPE